MAPLDDGAPAAAGDGGTVSKSDLPALFLKEIQAENGTAAPEKAAETSETVATEEAPIEAAPETETQESEAVEADDTATAEPDDAAPEKAPSDVEAIAAPSGMSDADKAQFDKLPSDMKAWVTKQAAAATADYTRKSQAVAEQKKYFDTGVTEVVARLKTLDGYLAKFTDNEIAPPDPALRNSDPMAYDEQLAAYMHAEHQKKIAAKERERVQAEARAIEEQQQRAWVIEQTETLRTLAPDLLTSDGKFDKGKFQQIQDYGVKAGYSPQQLANASAIDVLTLWKAQRFDAIEAAKKAVKPVAATPPKAVKPGPAKAVGRPSALSGALKALDIKPSRENLASAYLAEIRSEKR